MSGFTARTTLALVVLAGCGYDWTIGPVDAGADGAELDGRAADDAASDTQSGDGAKSCAAIHADVDNARAAAKHCTSMPTDCATSMKDQCGCILFIAQPSSSATTSYLQAISAFKDSGCPLGCGACGVPPSQSLCTAGAGPDGGLTTNCNP